MEAVTKLFFRWGVDGSFMRFWYDCENDRARQRLASTLFFFLLGTNGVLLAGCGRALALALHVAGRARLHDSRSSSSC